ncbi:hypothetical protein TNCV_1547891 [Trichonephila clavipes]|nr:hypothetical protein TNCV_1547891 [Trichonephila clavipes]
MMLFMGTLPSSRRGKCVTLFGGVRGTPRNSSACKQQQGLYTNYCCNPYGKGGPLSLSRVTGVLTSKEVDDATKLVIQTVQESQFHSEIQLLNKKHPLPNSSKLLPHIFLDTDGIIKAEED